MGSPEDPGRSRPPQVFRVGGAYDPAPVREKTRRQLALILAALVFGLALLLVIFTATDLLTSAQAKDLAAAVLSPVIAVTGTALGFYFGGRRNGS
jgi:hypothetical protein